MRDINSAHREVIQEIKNTSIEQFIEQYENNFPIDEFAGHYPIRVLHKNILQEYNYFSEEAEAYLKDDVFKLVHGIEYHIGTYKSPKIEYQKDGWHKTIISEPFCAYLWSVAYCIILHHEFDAQQTQIEKEIEEFEVTEEMLKRSMQLLGWGVGLSDHLTDWDYQRTPSPYPTSLLIGSESLYCLITNNVYKYAILACLYHELGHAVTLPVYPEKPTSEERKMYEREADNFMQNLMLKEFDQEKSFGIALGITVAFFSILLKTPPGRMVSQTHPDTDSRVMDFVENLETCCITLPPDLGEDLLDTVKIMSCYLLQIYFQMFNIDPQTNGSQRREFDTPDEALSYFFAVLNGYK